MPTYEFFCATCGSFESRRSFEEAKNPMRCPTCEGDVRRVYSMPGLVKTPPAVASALYRTEKSAHEPEVVRRRQPPAGTVSHTHGRPWQLGH